MTNSLPFGQRLPLPGSPELHASHGVAEHKIMRATGLAGLGAGAVALAPIVTHAFAPAGSTAWSASEFAINACGTGIPTGWAAGISNVVSGIPGVGPTLAAGGYATIGAAAALAVGGMWLGHLLDKHAKPGGFPWGKALRWGLLATSALIAAPMIFSGLTMGLTFLGAYLGIPSLMTFASSTFGTLGATGALSGAAMAHGSAAIMAVHALTCVAPMGIAAFLLGRKEKPPEPPTKQPEFPGLPRAELPDLRQHDGRIAMPPVRSLSATA